GGAQVGEREFRVDDFDIGNGVHAAGDVHHILIFKATHHVHHGIGFANVRQELIAQAFALGGTRDQTCDVDEFDHGRHHALRLYDLGQLGKPGIRHFDHTDVG